MISNSSRGEEIQAYLSRHKTTLEDRVAFGILARRATTGRRVEDMTLREVATTFNEKFIPAYMRVFGIPPEQETNQTVEPIIKWTKNFKDLYKFLAEGEIAAAIDPEMAARLTQSYPNCNPYNKLAAVKIAAYFQAYKDYTQARMGHASSLLRQASQPSPPDQPLLAQPAGETHAIGNLIEEFLDQHSGSGDNQSLSQKVARAYQAWNDQSQPESIRYFHITAELFGQLAQHNAFSQIDHATRDRLLAEAIDEQITSVSQAEQRARSDQRGRRKPGQSKGSSLISHYSRQRENLIEYKKGLADPKKSLILDNQLMSALRITLQRKMVIHLFDNGFDSGNQDQV